MRASCVDACCVSASSSYVLEPSSSWPAAFTPILTPRSGHDDQPPYFLGFIADNRPGRDERSTVLAGGRRLGNASGHACFRFGATYSALLVAEKFPLAEILASVGGPRKSRASRLGLLTKLHRLATTTISCTSGWVKIWFAPGVRRGICGSAAAKIGGDQEWSKVQPGESKRKGEARSGGLARDGERVSCGNSMLMKEIA
ncbi:hypothetical protein KM043_006664 [Ampulex compressa]|nr:hypothetical protein KM043_006664 [Ampulex compressa]